MGLLVRELLRSMLRHIPLRRLCVVCCPPGRAGQLSTLLWTLYLKILWYAVSYMGFAMLVELNGLRAAVVPKWTPYFTPPGIA
eukprot:5312694-Amphidinium_carterae.2